MRHYITLPNTRRVSVGVYAKAWRTLLRANPHETYSGFAYTRETAESILHAMRGGLSERINAHIPGHGCGRKWQQDYQIAAWRDSRRLRDLAQHIRVYQFETQEARERFGHRLSKHDD